MTPRILITPGEPAGIGPDVTLQIAQQPWNASLLAIADPDLLRERAHTLNLPINIIECDPTSIPKHQAGSLHVFPIRLNTHVEAGKLNAMNASYVLRTLETASRLCAQQEADAIVTGPVHKGIINQSGMHFTGHTEFFADFCHVDQTIMLFVIDQLKVALLTTHLPLKDVPAAITKERLRTIITLLNTELKRHFHLESPRIHVCGLNPHAGENGYLGREELDTIDPTLAELRAEGINLTGSLPADTIFTPYHLNNTDAVLAMYHDQALPVVKNIGFDRAVNMTLGLPWVRTSVDHGTAVDIAGTGKADAGSMSAAIKLAIQLVS